MSKPNAMELVERYLQAVRFWLPKNTRQEDLLAELGEDLRSQIDDKERELRRPLEEGEAAEILKRCGPPMAVASRLGPSRYLIGPALYPIYMFVLKMVLLWIQVPVFLFIIGPVNVANSGGDWASGIAETIGSLWSALFIAAGVITLVFVIVERGHALAAIECKWDPLKLPPVRKQERKPSLAHSVSELVFGVFGLVWLLLLPQHPAMILGPAAGFLKAAPMWHTFYLAIVLLSVLALLRSATILAQPQWTAFPLWTQLVQGVLTLILLNFILSVAGQPGHGDWHPFVMAANNVRESAKYVRVAAIVNVSILTSLAFAWFGLCIGIAVHLWKLLAHLRKRFSSSGIPASLHV